MSYRTFKRVLGETSLERKCRFLFGACLLLLISCSFWWYGTAMEHLIHTTNRRTGQGLVDSAMVKFHWVKHENRPGYDKMVEETSDELENLDYRWEFLALDPPSGKTHVHAPRGNYERDKMRELKQKHEQRLEAKSKPGPALPDSGLPAALGDASELELTDPETELVKDEIPIWFDRRLENHEYQYYQVVSYKEGCVSCHVRLDAPELASAPDAAELFLRNPPFRVVKVAIADRPTRYAIDKNRSILLATAIITVFLAMVALYVVVRYVIVKPLEHMREVSERVGKGDYQARAEIETNDEFEDLAHSFNRMLRHLVEAQEQLRDANTQLDSQVDQLAQANMQLYEMNQLKGDFLANVSHELRTPLNSIIGFSDVLLGISSLDDKQKRYASNIGRSGRVLLDTINDILDLAKVESGKMDVRPTEFSIAGIVIEQCELVRSLSEEKNIDLGVDCASNLPPIYQDQAKVQQILTNLLSNAIKFTPEGGRIKVHVRRLPANHHVKSQLEMTVTDTGVGIAEEDREIIFEKFRQARATVGEDNLTRQYSGTGLGLSIVKELCRLLGGQVEFTSQLGQGSSFKVRLPWALSDDQRPIDLGSDPALPQGRSSEKTNVPPAPKQSPSTDSSGVLSTEY